MKEKENKVSVKQFQEFLDLFSQLQIYDLIALCQIMSTPMGYEKQEGEEHARPRELADILEEVMDKFLALPRASRKDLLKVMRIAVKNPSPEPKEFRGKRATLHLYEDARLATPSNDSIECVDDKPTLQTCSTDTCGVPSKTSEGDT